MKRTLIHACAVAIGAFAVSTAIAVAENGAPLEPPVGEATVTCHRSVDPGFVATIEDLSNDRGFFTTFENISNDSGFLYPEPLEPQLPDGASTPPCLPVVPLPKPGQP